MNKVSVLWTPSPLSRKTGTGSRRKPPKPKGKWSVTCYATQTPTSLWGHLGSTQACWRSWQMCSPSHFPSSISSPSWLGRSQLTGRWLMWHPSSRMAGKRIPGTTGLLVWPRCQGSLWSRSSWVPSHGTHRTTRWWRLVSMDLWKAGPAWITWSPSMTWWPA